MPAFSVAGAPRHQLASEKARAQIQPVRRHAQRNQQSCTAKYRYRHQRVVVFRVCRTQMRPESCDCSHGGLQIFDSRDGAFPIGYDEISLRAAWLSLVASNQRQKQTLACQSQAQAADRLQIGWSSACPHEDPSGYTMALAPTSQTRMPTLVIAILFSSRKMMLVAPAFNGCRTTDRSSRVRTSMTSGSPINMMLNGRSSRSGDVAPTFRMIVRSAA